MELLSRQADSETRERSAHPPVQWPACYPARSSDYDSGRCKVTPRRDGQGVCFSTVSLPRTLEAHVTIGGIPRGSGRVTLAKNRRALSTPDGHFARENSYRFPYTFLFYAGENELRLEFPDGPVPDLSQAWYRISDAIYSDMIHTYPIVGMDMMNDEWVALFTNRVIEVVRKYGIDAVHIDASHLWSLDDEDAKIDRRLMKELPDIVFSTEKPIEPSMVMYRLGQQGVVPEDEAIGRFSPLADLISRPYRRLYHHLCGARGFVPVATVCNVRRTSQTLNQDELAASRRVFQRSPEFGVLRNIRVNYRDYGLDPKTLQAILSLYADDAR